MPKPQLLESGTTILNQLRKEFNQDHHLIEWNMVVEEMEVEVTQDTQELVRDHQDQNLSLKWVVIIQVAEPKSPVTPLFQASILRTWTRLRKKN